MSKNGLTSRYFYAIISKFVTTSAAIAQPVERILGKDEVASSNLASSSKKEPRPSGLGSFFAPPDLNHLNASVRWPLARSQLDGIDSLIFAPPTQGQKCKQIWLAAPASTACETAGSIVASAGIQQSAFLNGGTMWASCPTFFHPRFCMTHFRGLFPMYSQISS